MPDPEFPNDALEWQFTRAGGPGGQHVNKTSSAVVLKAHLNKLGLPQATLDRLRRLAGARLTRDDVLVLRADGSRSQFANREAALARLTDLVKRASIPIKQRVPTRVSRAKKRRRSENKKQHSAKKQTRRRPDA